MEELFQYMKTFHTQINGAFLSFILSRKEILCENVDLVFWTQ